MALNFQGSAGHLLRAAGLVDLTVGGFFHVDGALSFEKSSTWVTLADGSSVQADMLNVGGSGLDAFVGVGHGGASATGLALGDVSFGLALFTARSPAAAGLQWTALKANAGSVALVGISDLTLEVSNLSVEINLVSGVAPAFDPAYKVIDFGGTHGLDVATGNGSALRLDMAGSAGQLLRASGTGHLAIGGFFDVSGNLGFERASQTVTLADGQVVNTEMLTVGGTNLAAFAGVGGPYWTDRNANGRVDAGETNAAARGLSVSGVDFGLALLVAKPGQAHGGQSLDGARWTALKADIGAVDALVGLPPDVRVHPHDLSVQINLASGMAAPQVIDFSGAHALAVVAGTGRSFTLDMDGRLGELLRVAGSFEVALGGFFQVSGSMAFEKSSRAVVLADGTALTADVLTLGGAGLEAFVGVNGPYRSDSNGDGRIDNLDAVDTTATGLSVSGVNFGLAMLFDPGQSGLSWTALQATAASVALVGVQGVTASASDLLVQINQVSGVGATDAKVIDFAGAHTMAVATGSHSTVNLAMAGSQGRLLRASGHFELGVAGFVHVSGALGFEKSHADVTLADGTAVTVDTLTVGGTGLDGFVGVGGPDPHSPGAIGCRCAMPNLRWR